MMQKYICNIFLFFLFFSTLIFSIIALPDAFRYWDEAIYLILLSGTVILVLGSKDKIRIKSTDAKIVLLTIFIVVIGLVGNMIFGYMDSVNAIVRDVVNFSKFPLSFVIVRYLGFDAKIAKSVGRGFIMIIKCLVAIMFICAIISLFVNIGMSQNEIRHGIRPYQFLFSHPTFLVLVNIYLLAALTTVEKKRENLPYILMCSTIVLLSMRTKGMALVAVFLFMKYGSGWLRRFKVIYWITAVSLVFAVGYNKLELLNSFSNSARESLYVGCLTLLRSCFPIGSGFGTFASHLSGRYGSGVYDFIYIPEVWVNGQMSNVLGDVGYPYYIGQFGLFGTIAFGFILYYFYKAIIKENLRENLGPAILFLYIGIALTTESTLVNSGVDIAIILAVMARISQEKMKQKQLEMKGQNY